METSAIGDMAFFPNIVPPRPIGRLPKIYPQETRKKEREATVYVSMVIGKEGNVVRVDILGVKLSKPLVEDMAQTMKKQFEVAAVKILQGTRFSSTIIDGKKVPIVMEMPLKCKLN